MRSAGKGAVAGAFGLVGGLVAAAMTEIEGKRLVREDGLEDPTVRVKDRVASALRARLEAGSLRSVQEPLESDEIEQLKARFENTVVMDFMTHEWWLAPRSPIGLGTGSSTLSGEE